MRRILAILILLLCVQSCERPAPPPPSASPPGGTIPPSVPQPYGGATVRPANPWYESMPRGTVLPGEQIQEAYSGGYTHEPANPFNIGLLVPLSGRFSTLGQQMMEAAQLALFNFHDARINLMPFDTKEDAYGAVEAFKQAQARDMDVILGPLFSDATAAIADDARQAHIPLVSFSNDVAMTQKGAFVFGLLPQTQYETLVRFALSQNIRDFSLLAPNNVYGGTVLKTVRNMFKDRDDISLSRIELYRADRNLTADAMQSHIDSAVSPLLKGNSAYSALILPETGPRLVAIMEALRAMPGFLEKVQVIGDASWTQNPEIMASRSVTGAWVALPPQEKQRQFEQQFVSAYRHAPGKLAALAYDGVSMVVSLVRKYKAERLAPEMLTDPRGFEGIHGLYSFAPDRSVRRNLAIYRADGTGNLILLAAAPERAE